MHSGNNDTLDIFIADCFRNYDQFGQNLIAEKLFSNVYFYSYSVFREKISNHFFQKILEICTPNLLLNHLFSGKIEKNYYDRVFISTIAPFAATLIFRNPDADVFYYDDGVGSYIMGVGVSTFSKGRRLISFLTGHNYNKFNPKAVYLRNVDFGHLQYDCELVQIQNSFIKDKDEMDQLKRVFSYKNSSLYNGESVILIDNPDLVETSSFNKNIDCNIKKLVASKFENSFIRPHPRQKEVFDYGIRIDSSGNFWELLCADQITDDCCLIGSFSTAQMSPKMLFNKEPYLIFTYKLFEEGKESVPSERLKSLIQMLRDSYVDPKRIHEVESIEEIKAVLQQLIDKKDSK